MPAARRDARVLDEELLSVAAAVRRIEDLYGHAVDVECVVAENRAAGDPVHVVQSRPVTG